MFSVRKSEKILSFRMKKKFNLGGLRWVELLFLRFEYF